jgi:hypothetical protein
MLRTTPQKLTFPYRAIKLLKVEIYNYFVKRDGLAMAHTPAQTACFSAENLRSFMERILAALGLPEEDAKITGDVLIEAELRGIDSHGIGRLSIYVERLLSGKRISFPPDSGFRSSRNRSPGWRRRNGTGHSPPGYGNRHQEGKGNRNLRGCRPELQPFSASQAISLSWRSEMEGRHGIHQRPTVNLPTFGLNPCWGQTPSPSPPTDMDFPFLFDALRPSSSAVP